MYFIVKVLNEKLEVIATGFELEQAQEVCDLLNEVSSEDEQYKISYLI